VQKRAKKGLLVKASENATMGGKGRKKQPAGAQNEIKKAEKKTGQGQKRFAKGEKKPWGRG